MLVFSTIFVVLFIIEVLYLKFATLRHIEDFIFSSENKNTPMVRGAGIIIIPSILLFILFFNSDLTKELIYFFTAILILALISFIDDIKSLPVINRLVVHVIGITFIFISLEIFNETITLSFISLILIGYFFSIGFINIYNFMDGINGMSFLNALCSYVTFLLLNSYFIQFTNNNLIVVFILMTLVFGYFNFRKHPLCYLGDVGSISIGCTILYFALKLFLLIKNPFVFMIIGLYFLDGGLTIFERLIKRENIFKPHLNHLYELLVYKLNLGHLKIAFFYFVFQVILNAIIFISIKTNFNNNWSFIILSGLLSLLYYITKKSVYKKINILNESN